MSEGQTFLRELCDLEIPGDIQFSPDSEQVLYSTCLSWGSQKGRHPVSTIWVAAAAQAFSSKPLTSGTFKDFAPRWHPSGKTVAFISDRARAGAKWAIYTQNVASPTEIEAITPIDNEKAIKSFEYSSDGESIAYTSEDEKTDEQKRKEQEGEDVQVWGQDWPYARLRVVNAQTAHIRTLDLERHVNSFCWNAAGTEIAIVSCKTTDFEEPFVYGSKISIVNKDLTTIRDLCHFPSVVQDLTWANDGKLYFWSGVSPGKKLGGYGVYAVDCDSQTPVCEHTAFGIDDDAYSLTKVDGKIIAKVEHRLEDRIVDLSGKVLYGNKQEIESFDVSPSVHGQAPKVAVATSSVNYPVEVYVTTDGDQSMLQLSNHGSKFEGRTFGICHYLTCSSTDGDVELDSLYLEPAGHVAIAEGSTRRNPLPTVVLIHGGPTTRLTNAFNTYYYMLAPYLLSLGIGVLIPNYRGSSGRGEEFASYSIGGAGVYDYADIIATTQSAIDQGFANSEQMIVGGWSQGGMLTNLCCVRNGLHGNGWRFKAAISGASVCDYDTMALTSEMGSSYPPELHQGGVIWNMDQSDIRCRSASALWAFKSAMDRSKDGEPSIIPPILILHGAEDKRTPVSQAWGLRRALEHYSLPFELAVYPRQGHFFHEQRFWIDMAMRVGEWCDKYLGREPKITT